MFPSVPVSMIIPGFWVPALLCCCTEPDKHLDVDVLEVSPRAETRVKVCPSRLAVHVLFFVPTFPCPLRTPVVTLHAWSCLPASCCPALSLWRTRAVSTCRDAQQPLDECLLNASLCTEKYVGQIPGANQPDAAFAVHILYSSNDSARCRSSHFVSGTM